MRTGGIDPNSREANPETRKPRPGMLLDCMSHFGVDSKQAIYVGDQGTDRQAAQEAKVKFVYASDYFNKYEEYAGYKLHMYDMDQTLVPYNSSVPYWWVLKCFGA